MPGPGRKLAGWFLLGVGVATAGGAADDARAIVGVWQFAGETDTRADGTPAPGASLSDTQGLLLYTADGFVSVTLMPKGRKWSTESATLPELRETVENGTAYAGRYELDAAHHTITHITLVSMEAPYEGKHLVRGYRLSGDTLQLTGTYPYQGETIHFAIKWTRAKAH